MMAIYTLVDIINSEREVVMNFNEGVLHLPPSISRFLKTYNVLAGASIRITSGRGNDMLQFQNVEFVEMYLHLPFGDELLYKGIVKYAPNGKKSI